MSISSSRCGCSSGDCNRYREGCWVCMCFPCLLVLLCIPSFRKKLWTPGCRPGRVLFLGADGAGKTTILYALKLGIGTYVDAAPTIGFNIETVSEGNWTCDIWDVGGQEAVRPLWRHYYYNTVALVFVVDAADHSQFGDRWRARQRALRTSVGLATNLPAVLVHLIMGYSIDPAGRTDTAKILHGVLNMRKRENEELREAPVLIYANKQDLPGALSAEALSEMLDLKTCCPSSVVAVSAAVSSSPSGGPPAPGGTGHVQRSSISQIFEDAPNAANTARGDLDAAHSGGGDRGPLLGGGHDEKRVRPSSSAYSASASAAAGGSESPRSSASASASSASAPASPVTGYHSRGRGSSVESPEFMVRRVKVQPCSAVNGQGLREGLLWLRDAIAARYHTGAPA